MELKGLHNIFANPDASCEFIIVIVLAEKIDPLTVPFLLSLVPIKKSSVFSASLTTSNTLNFLLFSHSC